MTNSDSNLIRKAWGSRARINESDKRCGVCKKTKPKSDFGRLTKSADGYHCRCKECNNRINRETRIANPEASSAYTKKWVSKNYARKRAYDQRWLEENKDWANERSRIWIEKNRERIRENSEKRKSSIQYRINHAISARIYSVLKGKDGRKTSEILGYSPQELVIHLEKQFTEGMSWENYGDWHVDHIRPLASFNFTGPHDPELRQAWGLPNLRPIWAIENLKKKDKLTHLI